VFSAFSCGYQIGVERAESPKDDSPGQSESASDALGNHSQKSQALKGRQKFVSTVVVFSRLYH
jgi:hypothetical protein